MSKLEFYCTEFGLYTSDKEASDFGKVPEPSLSEVQEVQSSSFLSFREILNYWIALTIFFITFKVPTYRFLYICILLYICAFFRHFSAREVNFVHIFTSHHGIQKLSPRTPHKISRRIFWCNKIFLRWNFDRKLDRKWTGNNDNHLFQSRFQTTCNLYGMLLRVCTNWNLCDVSLGTKVPEKSSSIESKKSATVKLKSLIDQTPGQKNIQNLF